MAQKQAPKQKKPRRDWHRIFVTVIAFLLVVMLIAPMIFSIFGTAGATGANDLRGQINSLQKDASSYSGKKAEIKEKLKEIAGDKSQALEQKGLLDDELAYIDQEIANTEQQISYYNDLIAQEETNLVEAQNKEKIQYELFCERVRAMEESGTVSYWSILFSAKDFSDLLDRATAISEIMEFDNAVMESLKVARHTVEETLTSLATAKTEQDAKKAELDGQHTEQAAKVSTANKLIQEIEDKEGEYQAALQAAKAEEDRVNREIAKREKELEELMRQNQVSFDVGSGYQWPVAGHYYLTSAFGPRIRPNYGYTQNHTGLDIAAPKNAPIAAVRGGVVTVSDRGSSYGNYVVVSHGNGDSSLYAHMTSRAVNEGDVVAQGQVIGYVGSTGNSTGNHLHLEIRVGGSRKNPVNIFSGISGNFSYSSSY